MGGGKETPRQKMIGLMYLVLMALLAMNVSKSILEAFVIINDGIEATNRNFEAKNEYTYAAFDKAKMNDPRKVTASWKKGQQVKNLANEMDKYVDDLKLHLIGVVEKIEDQSVLDTMKLKDVANKDNYDVPSHILIGDEPANPRTGEWSAEELKEKINKYRETMLGFLSAEDQKGMNLGLETGDIKINANETKPWADGMFEHVPLAAVVTELTKIQADIRNAEADVVKKLLGDIGADDFKFDVLAPKVMATNYLTLGDTFKADVFVAAFSSTQDPKIEVSLSVDTAGNIIGAKETEGVSVGGGMGHFRYKPTTEGLVEWGGVISIKKPDGSYKAFNFKHTFITAKPALVVSPTAMNVLYRGLDNPVEISVSGIPTEKLQISISNASKSGTKGKLKVRPGKGRESVVSVSADLGGKKQSFGKFTFRVKDVPDPKPFFAGVSGGNVKKAKLTAQSVVLAKMENFQFDLKFRIISFNLSATIKGKVVDKIGRGAKLSKDMKAIIRALKPGQKFYIEKIKAKGPDGRIRNLGSMSYKIL